MRSLLKVLPFAPEPFCRLRNLVVVANDLCAHAHNVCQQTAETMHSPKREWRNHKPIVSSLNLKKWFPIALAAAQDADSMGETGAVLPPMPLGHPKYFLYMWYLFPIRNPHIGMALVIAAILGLSRAKFTCVCVCACLCRYMSMYM